MIALLPAEIRRQIGRKGTFFGAMVWIGLFALGTLIWAMLSSSSDATTAIQNGGGLLLFATTIAGIVIGATAGAYDVDNGTMRYLVLTGRPRWQLVGVRVLAFPVTIALVALPAMLVVVVAGVVAGGEPATGELYLDLFYGPFMAGVLYGTLGLCIGTFLKSVGVAIAVAVVLNFAGLVIVPLIYENVSEELARGFFTIVALVAIDREAATGPESTFSLSTSILILLIWLAALIGAAIARVQRSEY